MGNWGIEEMGKWGKWERWGNRGNRGNRRNGGIGNLLYEESLKAGIFKMGNF